MLVARQSLSSKTILITGATKGIGLALARSYAAPYCTLILLGRNKTRLRETVLDCQKRGAHVISLCIDVKNRQALQHEISQLDKQYPIDLVIANAGMTSNTAEGIETWDKIEQVLDTNLYGALATIYPLISTMQQRQKGQIALVSSLAAYQGMSLTPAYCSSKAAIKSFGESLRDLLREDNIKVNVIMPGFVRSHMSDQFPAPKPFIMTPEKAALLIRRGLEKNKAKITFPFPLNLSMWFLSIIPDDLANKLLKIFKFS